MNLAARRSARQRENFVMRLGCLLVSFAVVASLVFYPPKAKAFVATSSAVSALAGGFLNACGLAPVVSGMSSSGEVNESIARLIQEYLESISVTADEWLGRNLALTVTGGKLYLPKPLAQKLGQFAVWVASKYAAKPGVNSIYNETGSYIILQDGSKFYLTTFTTVSGYKVVSQGSTFQVSADNLFYFGTGYYYAPYKTDEWGPYTVALFSPNGQYVTGCAIAQNNPAPVTPYTICVGYCSDIKSDPYRIFASWNSRPFENVLYLSDPSWLLGDILSADESLTLDVSDTMQQVLDRLTALEDGQSIALDVGATQTMGIQEILQGILDAILAGNLDASAEIVDTAEVPVDPPVDPPAEELPDVDGLGLPALGAALTSRFPFSIPWDVYKGVTLLAAPPKAPYFEVDFMAPIADRVGGWQGSTTIVLDFSEYEIIGQVCRWTSTIGFCLMLATGTKRLIWTA